MTKYKSKRKVVGCNNYEKKAIARPLVELIITYQNKLQVEENKKRKPKKITWVYASLLYGERNNK